jgi:aspartate carbamoyltransferase regulatory subunit
MNKKTLKISAIGEGTVIDHISTNNTFKVAEILNLKDGGNIVTVGMNLESKKLGKKGVIKIGERFLTKEEVDKIALVAPEANINIIKGYGVKKKFKVEIPNVIHGIIKCANTDCITNKEFVRTKFYVLGKDPLKLRCHYCERTMGKDDIESV